MLNIDTLIESDEGGLLVKARTELAAIDLESSRIRKAETVDFKENMVHPVHTEGLEFSRFPKTDMEYLETINVRSTSLDYCYHTNNIECVRFVLNTYSSEFFRSHEPVRLEIHYADQSFEGEKLDIDKYISFDDDMFSITRNGKTVTSCRLAWSEA